MFSRIYPERTLLTHNERGVLGEFYKNFEVKVDSPPDLASSKVATSMSIDSLTSKDTATASVHVGNDKLELPVRVGTRHGGQDEASTSYVSTPTHDALLADLTVTHAANADFCVLGARGSGSTTLVEKWARRLGYDVDTIALYADLNSRELLQTRIQLPNGDTIWSDSLLVAAAKAGRVCVLDGLERVHWSTIGALAPLIHHRLLVCCVGSRYNYIYASLYLFDQTCHYFYFQHLPDGTRLVSQAAFDSMLAKSECTASELNDRYASTLSLFFSV